MPDPPPPTTDIATVPIDDLIRHPETPRRGDIPAISASIEVNGWYGAVVAQSSTSHVLAGNNRMEAARRLGMTELPVHWLDVDDATARRIMLADNRTSDLATYDDAVLVQLLEAAAADDDLLGSGFDGDDLDALLAAIAGDRDEGSVVDPGPSDPPSDPITKVGDLILLGDHRLLCGDCRSEGDVARLMGDAAINMAFTSPPYAQQRTYDESSGFSPIPPDGYVDWFDPVQVHIRTRLVLDGSWFINIKPSTTPNGDATELYVLDLVLAHARRWGWNFATEFCWERSGVPKAVNRRFKNQFEPIYQFALGRWKFNPERVQYPSADVPRPGGPGVGDTNWANAQGGNGPIFGAMKKRRHGTTELMADNQGTNAAPGEFIGPGMAYPGNRLPTFSGSHEALGHTAAFPVGLPEWFVKVYTDDGDTVYDPFMGSGSTLIAADKHGRKCYGMEISPAYCDVIVTRWEEATGQTAMRP